MIEIIPLYTLSICVSSWSGADAGRLTFAAHIITFCSVKIASLLCVNISLHVKITGNAYSGFSTVFCAVGGKVKKILLMCIFQDLKPLYSFLSQYSLKASVKTTVIAFWHVM